MPPEAPDQVRRDVVNLALGGTVSAFAKPNALDAAYGDNPMGFTLFARVSLGR